MSTRAAKSRTEPANKIPKKVSSWSPCPVFNLSNSISLGTLRLYLENMEHDHLNQHRKILTTSQGSPEPLDYQSFLEPESPFPSHLFSRATSSVMQEHGLLTYFLPPLSTKAGQLHVISADKMNELFW